MPGWTAQPKPREPPRLCLLKEQRRLKEQCLLKELCLPKEPYLPKEPSQRS
jgi:hypothetical protein